MYIKIFSFVKSSTGLQSHFEGDDSVSLSLSHSPLHTLTLCATIRDRRVGLKSYFDLRYVSDNKVDNILNSLFFSYLISINNESLQNIATNSFLFKVWMIRSITIRK